MANGGYWWLFQTKLPQAINDYQWNYFINVYQWISINGYCLLFNWWLFLVIIGYIMTIDGFYIISYRLILQVTLSQVIGSYIIVRYF